MRLGRCVTSLSTLTQLRVAFFFHDTRGFYLLTGCNARITGCKPGRTSYRPALLLEESTRIDAVLPPVTDTLDTPRPALRGAGMPAQARSVSFAESVRGDARECLTRARRGRRAERFARRPTRASRVVVEESARSRTPPRHMGRAPPPSPPEASRGRAARRGQGPRG